MVSGMFRVSESTTTICGRTFTLRRMNTDRKDRRQMTDA